MATKRSTNANTRGAYSLKGGDDVETGVSNETAKGTIAGGLAAIALLTPPPVLTDSVVLTGTGGGAFINDPLNLTSNVNFEGRGITLNSSDGNPSLTGTINNCSSIGKVIQTSLVATDAILLDDASEQNIDIPLLFVTSPDCAGLRVTGNSDSIFTSIAQTIITGDGGSAISWEASSGSGSNVLNYWDIRLNGNNERGLVCNSTDGEVLVANFGSLTSLGTPTGVKGLHIIQGEVSVICPELDMGAANEDVHVEDGGVLYLFGGVSEQDINVDVGGTLHTHVLKHGGTVTNNGTISGLIGSDFYSDLSLINDLIMKGATSGQLTFDVPATVTDYTITWPDADGALGQVLALDGSGNFIFVDNNGSPNGADTQVQFNNGGVFAGSPDFVFDGTNVGVGTDLPRQRLHVKTGGTSSYTTASNLGLLITDDEGPRLIFEDTGEGTDEKVILQRWQSGLFSFNTINDAGSSFIAQNILTINGSTQNIGIGTNTANQRLHVVSSGSSGFTGAQQRGILITDNVAPAIVFEDAGEGVDQKIIRMAYGDQSISFNALSDDGSTSILANILVINRDGNIGIGIAAPSAPLEVQTADVTTEAVIFKATSQSGRTLSILQPDIADPDAPFVFQTNNAMTFRVDAVDALIIDDSGNSSVIGLTANTITINTVNDGDTLLNFNTPRRWQFQQEGTGSGAALRLRNTLGINKNFFIDTDGSTAWRNTDGTTTFMTMDQGTGNLVMENSILMRAANTAAIMSDTQTLGFRRYYNYTGSASTVDWTINTADMIKADVSHVWEFTVKDKAGVASVANPINIIAESGFIDFAGTTQISITTNGGSISFLCDGTNIYTVN